MENRRVVYISEILDPPYDEGIKKTVYNLFQELDSCYDVEAICRKGFPRKNVNIVNLNSLHLSTVARNIIRNHDTEILIYFPYASATFASYIRLKILSLYWKKAKSIFIALQPKPLKRWQRLFVSLFLRPKYALTPSPELKQFWDSIKAKNQLLPLSTDLNVFKPVRDAKTKEVLRAKYNLPLSTYIISHMGHINYSRNLLALRKIQKSGRQVIIVASSSTPVDAIGPSQLKRELEESGMIILDRYIENIFEIYQLSDLYIFPVIEKNSSIGMPLSVLEARACGIPVLTTNFGSLRLFLSSDYYNIYYAEPNDFDRNISQIELESNKDRYKTKVHSLNRTYYRIIHSCIKKMQLS